MRVSFESGLITTSPPAAWAVAPTRSLQQPVPAIVAVVSSLRQYPCGAFVPGAVSDPGWFACGGIAYWFTGTTWLDRWSAGVPVFSDDVFESVQITIWLDV